MKTGVEAVGAVSLCARTRFCCKARRGRVRELAPGESSGDSLRVIKERREGRAGAARPTVIDIADNANAGVLGGPGVNGVLSADPGARSVEEEGEAVNDDVLEDEDGTKRESDSFIRI